MGKNGKRERLRFWEKSFGWDGQELGQSFFGKVNGWEVVWAGGFSGGAGAWCK